MPLDAIIELTELKLSGSPKDKLTAAEPNLWTVFFTFDGARLVIDEDLRLVGDPEFTASVGTHNSLRGARVGTDGHAIIPADCPDHPEHPLGRYATRLTPFELPEIAGGGLAPAPGTDPDPVDPGGLLGDLLGARRRVRPGARPALAIPSPLAPAFGVIYVILEADRSKERTVESAHGAFNAAIREALAQVVVNLGRDGVSLSNPSLSERERRAIAERVRRDVIDGAGATAKANLDLGSATDHDDFIGAGGRVFTLLDLAEPETFVDRFVTPFGTWTIFAKAEVL
jgi:hypothetical protein